jgi:hypothetical protein
MSLFDREAIPSHLLQGRYVAAEDDQADCEDDIITLRAYSLIGLGVSEHLFRHASIGAVVDTNMA